MISTDKEKSTNNRSTSSFDINGSKNYVKSDDSKQFDIDVQLDISASIASTSEMTESLHIHQEDMLACK